MGRFRRWIHWPLAGRALVAETAGFTLVSAGLHQVYEPAALVFAGIALIFVAQGLERDE